MRGEPANHMLAVQHSICQLLEIGLWLELVVEGETENGDLVGRRYGNPIDFYWISRVWNALTVP